MYVVLSGYHPYDPFGIRTPEAMKTAIDNGAYDFNESSAWLHVSQDAKDIIGRLLVRDPSARLTAKQLLASPWCTSAGYITDCMPVPVDSGAAGTPACTVGVGAADVKLQEDPM
jgi:serine/threonine protein kinase